VLYIALEALRAAAVLAHPILPEATGRIWTMLGCEEYLGKIDSQRPDQLKWGELKPGTKVGKPQPIFPRLDKAATLDLLDNLAEADRNRDKPKEKLKPVESENSKPSDILPESPKPTADSGASRPVNLQIPFTTAPESPKISIDDFAKVEMRTGQIKTAEAIPGAKKLLKLTVDIGTEVRQVCAGIAEFYAPEKLIGMKVVVVTNLEPRKLRGVESNGMIVAASVGEEGRPVLATFGEDVPNGVRLK
jgi:methionyl-tRNA synthetase